MDNNHNVSVDNVVKAFVKMQKRHFVSSMEYGASGWWRKRTTTDGDMVIEWFTNDGKIIQVKCTHDPLEISLEDVVGITTDEQRKLFARQIDALAAL